MPDWLQDLVKYADEHADGLGVLYTLLGGAVVALLFLARPIFAYLFPKEKQDSDAKTVVNVNTLDIEAIRELLQASPETTKAAENGDAVTPKIEADHADDGNSTITERDVQAAGATLSKFREMLKPIKALSPEVFPKGMRVVHFDPDKSLSIALESTGAEKGCLAAFSVMHWTIFPGMAGSFIGQALGEWGVTIGGFVGSAVGLANWFRLSRRGPVIKLNFQKQTCDHYHVAAASWGSPLPEATIKSEYEKDMWTATVQLGASPVASNTSSISQAEAEEPLRDFVNALNWRLGNRIAVAEGVYIEPPSVGTA